MTSATQCETRCNIERKSEAHCLLVATAPTAVETGTYSYPPTPTRKTRQETREYLLNVPVGVTLIETGTKAETMPLTLFRTRRAWSRTQGWLVNVPAVVIDGPTETTKS